MKRLLISFLFVCLLGAAWSTGSGLIAWSPGSSTSFATWDHVEEYTFGYQSTPLTGTTYGDYEYLISAGGNSNVPTMLSCGTTIGTGRPGCLSFSTNSASANGYASLISKTDALSTSATSVYTFDEVLRFPTLSSTSSSVSTLYTSRWGFIDAVPTPGMGCWFEYTGSTSQAVSCKCAETAGSSSRSYLINSTGNSDGSFPLGNGVLTANTWTHFGILVYGTYRADFAINDTKVCEIDFPLSGGTPTTFGYGNIMIANGTSGIASRSMDLDWTRISASTPSTP